jgi:hypothetical protein
MEIRTGLLPFFVLDAFSSREPVSIPDQTRDRLSLENAPICFATYGKVPAKLMHGLP